jgi:hypothetical protein
MAVNYQQQTRIRKFVYAGLILALLTVSVIHRRNILEPQGNHLLLREVSKGEVKLTDSAVRLALTGSRGLAVTFLWSTALEKQKRHEWNELDLLVSSITRLQPHFVTPWLFQSWNLSFNVAVECDRPRDKYFYISRGLEVLAEGERRNYKPPSPGNPDMRQNLGFYYQLKIGNSDEKNTMRCLLEMSCIDPLDRAPDRLWEDTDRGKKVKLDKFRAFCSQYPRLVRRLHDQLGNTTPEDVVRFLDENKDVPSRFETPTGGPQQKDSVVKDELEQFPILPPGRPNPRGRDIDSNESVDVFYVCRQWFEYAQKPLPDPPEDPTQPLRPNPLRKRVPRYIAIQIFRGYPARAQAYEGENLEAEGWFDADGWAIPKWFDKERSPNDPEFRVGTEPKFYAGPAWDKAYRMYLDYGTANGLYLSPPLRAALTRTAQLYRKTYKLKEGEHGPERVQPGEMEESLKAHKLINHGILYAHMTNFPEFLVQTDAERTADAVTARKYFYNAARLEKAERDPERAIPMYQKASDLWIQVLLAHPEFARLSNVQEDIYEIQVPYCFYVQKHRAETFKPLLIGMAQTAIWPYPPLEEFLEGQKSKILPVRSHRGLLEYLQYYDWPDAKEVKMALAGWTQAAVPGMHVVTPAQVNLQLVRPFPRGAFLNPRWKTFVDEDTVTRVRERLGLTRQKVEKK